MVDFGFFVVGAVVVVVVAAGAVVVVDVAAIAPVATKPAKAKEARRRAAAFIAISVVSRSPKTEASIRLEFHHAEPNARWTLYRYQENDRWSPVRRLDCRSLVLSGVAVLPFGSSRFRRSEQEGERHQQRRDYRAIEKDIDIGEQ